MRIDKGKQSTIKDPNGLEFKIRKIDDFLNDAFNLPENQKFPHKHYEVKPFATVGCIASGKSTYSTQFIGNEILERWGRDNVDCYYASDLWATLTAVMNSDKQIFYLCLDDSIPMFDSRRSMGNVGVTQFFYEIRHELKKHALMCGGNAGGLVFICLIAQDLGAIDLRLRTSLGFTTYKTYDRGLDKIKLEPEIIRTLKKMKYQSVVCCNYFYRKLAVIIDCEDKYTLTYADAHDMPYVPFKYITGKDIFESQKIHLINHLVDNVNSNQKKWYFKAELIEEINRIEKSGEDIRIQTSDYEEIILMARKQIIKVLQERKNLERKLRKKYRLRQKRHLINRIIRNVDFNEKNWYFKAFIIEEIERMKKRGKERYISSSHYDNIILLARKKAKNLLDLFPKSNISMENNLIQGENGMWDISQIVYFKTVLKMSYKEIERNYGIPHTTCQRRYTKFLEDQNKMVSNHNKQQLETE